MVPPTQRLPVKVPMVVLNDGVVMTCGFWIPKSENMESRVRMKAENE